MFRSITTGLLAAGALALVQAPAASAQTCNAGYAQKNASHADQKASIVETAVAAGSFNTLATALKEAGLVEALQGEGPFTVFAPTDDAFAKLPDGTLESLLKPENRDSLVGILTFHVVPGDLDSADVLGASALTTLNGQRANISTRNGNAMIDGAKIVKTDIECSNGVIHVIDSVILPESNDIVDIATSAGTFNTLATALGEADLVNALRGEGPFTVFAPTDAAFAKLPEGTVESLLEPANRDKLRSILLYHVVDGRVFSDQAVKAGRAKTLQGQTVDISKKYGSITIDGAKVVKTDIDASNGVIHVIDSVILPGE